MQPSPAVRATAAVLVIEHHQEHRAMLESTLRHPAVTVESVDSGEAALMRLSMADYACIVLGSPVPVTFGTESSTILDLFDLLAPNLASRLIVVTRADAAHVVARALRMQAYAVFLDPFDPAELRDTVAMCLRGEVPPRRLHGTSEQIERLVAGEPSPAE